MKNVKNKLFSAVAMLIVAAVALTGATFAWISTITNPEVKSIDLFLKGTDAMLLSCYAAPSQESHWSASISKTDIEGQQATAFPDELLDVSSNILGGTGDAEFFKANLSTAGAVIDYYKVTTQYTVPAPAAKTEGHYVKFNLWVKSSKDGFVYLDQASVVTALTMLLSDGGTVPLTEPQLSIVATPRIAFVPLNYDADGVGGSAKSTGAAYGSKVIWEPNSMKHLPEAWGGPLGDPTAKIPTLGVEGANDATLSEPALTDTQVTYDVVSGGTNQSVATIAGTIGNALPLFNLSKGEANKQQFAIYIWVEGQDDDTRNAIAKSAFLSYLKFGQDEGGFIGAAYTPFA